ncbi:MAG: hypothetical protein AVDCRST_MAG15-2918, partial [uncultured Rubellimicrobium sp.]
CLAWRRTSSTRSGRWATGRTVTAPPTDPNKSGRTGRSSCPLIGASRTGCTSRPRCEPC